MGMHEHLPLQLCSSVLAACLLIIREEDTVLWCCLLSQNTCRQHKSGNSFEVSKCSCLCLHITSFIATVFLKVSGALQTSYRVPA